MRGGAGHSINHATAPAPISVATSPNPTHMAGRKPRRWPGRGMWTVLSGSGRIVTAHPAG